MNNLRLKHTLACQLCLYVPPLLLVVAGFVLLALWETLWGALLLGTCLLLALAYLWLLFPVLVGTEITLETIRYWQKDRLWFSLDTLGEDGTEVRETLLARIRPYGESCDPPGSATPAPTLVQYRRYGSVSALYYSRERILLAYQVSRLDEATYQKILTSARRVVNSLKSKTRPSAFLTKEEQNAPVCRAVAVVILADLADPCIPALARKAHTTEDTALLPFVAELSSRRCWFDGMREVYMLGEQPKPPKNEAISLITRVLFGGHLPLEDNDAFTHLDLDPEQPFLDYLREIRAASREDKQVSEKLAASLQDGQILVQEDVLYIRQGEQITSFLVDTEETPLLLFTDGCWDYPKRRQIRKTDMAALKESVRRYYAEQKLAVTFADEQEDE